MLIDSLNKHFPMSYSSHLLLIVVSTIIFTENGGALNGGNRLRPQINRLLNELQSTPMDAVLYWNLVALQACGNDYDNSVVPTPDQAGPTATSRAFAIIHGAMYDAMTVFNRNFKPLFRPNGMPNTNNLNKESATNAAIMEAAYQTLLVVYPQQTPLFNAVRKQYLNQLRSNENKKRAVNVGILVGQLVAQFILARRENDGSQNSIPYTPVNNPGYHQTDPTHPNQGYLGAHWGNVQPFLLDFGAQFRPANTVGNTTASRLRYLNSIAYFNDFNEVKTFGSKTSTTRTNDQTEIGIFWAYDGAPRLGVPPRLYNQVVRVIAIQERNTLEQNAHLFALVNYAMADAGIAAWDCKYYYNLWRPVVGIRQTIGFVQGDPNWLPLGAPADNNGTNFTPGFPSYVSGHSTFGSAIFEVLRLFYGKDNIRFQFQSDEYNGQTFDSDTGTVRPARSRSYRSFSQAERENFLSRIYLGVHWRIDQKNGRVLGRQVGQFVFNKLS